jgi:hypothetical protein
MGKLPLGKIIQWLERRWRPDPQPVCHGPFALRVEFRICGGMVPLAIGTETDGSVVCPASINGIVGIKPTIGLVSRRGIVPLAHSQDTAGPMATTVSDAAHLLTAITGHDPADAATDAGLPHFDHDYANDLDPNGLQGRRIGVARSQAGFHDGVDLVFERAVRDLEAAGAVIVDDIQLPDWPEGFWDASYDVLLYEFKADLNAYLAGLPTGSNQLTLEKLIAFNTANADRELRWFGQDIFEKAQEKAGLHAAEYLEAVSLVQKFTREAIDTALSTHDVDLLVMPTNAPAWVIDQVNGDHWIGGNSSFAAISGYPHITVPMGQSAFSEPTLIKASYAYEQATKHAVPPEGFGAWKPAVSENAGDQGSPLSRIIGELPPVPDLVQHGPSGPLDDLTEIVRAADPAKQAARWYAVAGFSGLSQITDDPVGVAVNDESGRKNHESDDEMDRKPGCGGLCHGAQCFGVVVAVETVETDGKQHQHNRKGPM